MAHCTFLQLNGLLLQFYLFFCSERLWTHCCLFFQRLYPARRSRKLSEPLKKKTIISNSNIFKYYCQKELTKVTTLSSTSTLDGSSKSTTQILLSSFPAKTAFLMFGFPGVRDDVFNVKVSQINFCPFPKFSHIGP